MTTYETLSLIVSAAAVLSIWFGVWQMRRAGDQRAAREDARHAEAMEAIQGGFRQQAESLQAVIKALESMGRGIETMIERTGGRA